MGVQRAGQRPSNCPSKVAAADESQLEGGHLQLLLSSRSSASTQTAVG